VYCFELELAPHFTGVDTHWPDVDHLHGRLHRDKSTRPFDVVTQRCRTNSPSINVHSIAPDEPSYVSSKVSRVRGDGRVSRLHGLGQ
jgi:hypothetical protein